MFTVNKKYGLFSLRGTENSLNVFSKDNKYIGKVYKTIAGEWKNSLVNKSFKTEKEAFWDLTKGWF